MSSNRRAFTLDANYDLSGGQIENIARKHEINCVLHGNEASPLHSLLQDCACDKLTNKEQRNRVGF